MRACRIRAEGTRSHANGARLKKVSLSAAEPENLSSCETKKNPARGCGRAQFTEFQFDECTDLRNRVKRQPLKARLRRTGCGDVARERQVKILRPVCFRLTWRALSERETASCFVSTCCLSSHSQSSASLPLNRSCPVCVWRYLAASDGDRALNHLGPFNHARPRSVQPRPARDDACNSSSSEERSSTG